MQLRFANNRVRLTLGCVLGFGWIAAAGASDWYDEEYQSCDQKSTATIVECVMGLHQAWDTRLNAAYRIAIEARQGEHRTALRDAQRAWISYRDANCAFYRSGEGTIAAIEGNACMFALTRDRALELELLAPR